MTRRDPDFFDGQDLVLVYMAKRLREALALEAVLDAGELDYAVEAAPYGSGTLFRSQRVGAFFYVPPETAERAQAWMLQNGYQSIKKS